MSNDEIIALISLLVGAALSWGIAHLYHIRSSVKTPPWAKEEFRKLAAALPDKPLTPQEFARSIIEALPKSNLAESGSNSDGDWFRYHNADQTCMDTFEIPPGQTTTPVTFPQAFWEEPSVELSGEVSQIVSKQATPTELIVEVKGSYDRDKPLVFNYQARGHWFNPSEVSNSR